MRKIKLLLLLILVIALPSSGALLLLLAGPADTPWILAQNLKVDNVDGSAWYHFSERQLSKDDIIGLVPLINQLKKADFEEDRSLESLPPHYGIKLNGDTLYISQADAPEGALAMMNNGRQWWIDNDALSIYIYKLCVQQAGDIIGPTLEPLVWAYVNERIKTIETEYKTQTGGHVEIIESEITKFEQVAAYDDILSTSVEVWLLEYRLLPDCLIDDLVMTAGMGTDRGFISESTKSGQPYMIVYNSNVRPSEYYGCVYTADIERAGGLKEAVLQKLTELG